MAGMQSGASGNELLHCIAEQDQSKTTTAESPTTCKLALPHTGEPEGAAYKWMRPTKRTHYTYELISGNVTQVTYQKDSTDQFIHQYQYDQDNRLKEVHTSKDNTIWDRDAKYFYYKHGPLARTERGDYMVQGEDFTYTINGCIKGYNSVTLDTARDIGKDGGEAYSLLHNNLHRLVARDSLGWVLGYYENDYLAISKPSSTVNFEATYAGTAFGGRGGNLYNGNIRHVAFIYSSMFRES
jgi:YD repeat-containing protein